MKVAIGSSGDCEDEWDLDKDCDVDKDDSKLLKIQQKEEKTAHKTRHKAEKAAMLVATDSRVPFLEDKSIKYSCFSRIASYSRNSLYVDSGIPRVSIR